MPFKKRLLKNDSRSAWAKPTQKEALESLAIRLERWATHVALGQAKIRIAAYSIKKLAPEFRNHAEKAIKHLEGTPQ